MKHHECVQDKVSLIVYHCMSEMSSETLKAWIVLVGMALLLLF